MRPTRPTTSTAAAPAPARGATLGAQKRFVPEAVASSPEALSPASERMLRILRGIGPFRYLPSSRLAPLAERGCVTAFQTGAELVRQDEVADRIYVIASGQVQVQQSHPQLTQPLVLAELGPGEVIGEMGVLSGRPCSATVVAIEPTEALEISATELPTTLRLIPEVSDILLRILSRRLRRTDVLVDSELRVVGPAADPVPDSVEEGVCHIDLLGRVAFANLAAARLTGYKIPELLGRDLHALVHPSRGGNACSVATCQVLSDLQGRDAEPAPAEREEHEDAFWRRDGSSCPVSYTTEPHYEDGEVAGTVLSFRLRDEQSLNDEYDSAESGEHGAKALPLAVGYAAR